MYIKLSLVYGSTPVVLSRPFFPILTKEGLCVWCSLLWRGTWMVQCLNATADVVHTSSLSRYHHQVVRGAGSGAHGDPRSGLIWLVYKLRSLPLPSPYSLSSLLIILPRVITCFSSPFHLRWVTGGISSLPTVGGLVTVFTWSAIDVCRHCQHYFDGAGSQPTDALHSAPGIHR